MRNAVLSADCLDVEPADVVLSDAAIESLARLLVDYSESQCTTAAACDGDLCRSQ
jgi:hypothetical protein